MKKKIYSQLWIYFACFIFLTLLLAAFFLIMVGLALFHFEVINARQGHPLLWVISTVFFSVVIGTAGSVFVGRRILHPISQLRMEMRKVAEGDFTAQLNENLKIAEVEELFHDFNLMVKELGTIETLRSDFIRNVSHEFKTPIATIRGYVQLLQNNDLSENDRQEYLMRILDGTQQLSRLTENILKLTKIETQGLSLEEQEFRLDEQIRSVILFLEPEWEVRNLEWQIDLDRSFYYGNEEFLYQVWLNIIGNAIKYSQENKKIKVTLLEKNDCLEVEVRDQGIGMNEHTKKHIFDKFFQGDTARKTKGNGLGLTLAQRIIDIYEGEIFVSSKEHVGTSIVVRLPKKIVKNLQLVHK